MMEITQTEGNSQEFQAEIDDTLNFTPETIKSRISHAWSVVKPYSGILDSEIVQFFNRDYWSLVPIDWRDYLMKLSVKELAMFMNAEQTDELLPKLPESLLKVRNEVKTLSLSRKQGKYHLNLPVYPVNDTSQQNVRDYNILYDEEMKQFPFYANLMPIDKKKPPLSFLKYKCKEKKLAEILIMGDLCFKTCLVNKVDFIVDIGAGLGHLSRCLAYFYGINVVSIEKEGEMTEEAMRLDKKFIKLLQNLARRDPSYSTTIKASILRITAEIRTTMTSKDLINLITEASRDEEDAVEIGNFNFGLVGLHPCGNLAPTILSLYKTTENCLFIHIASCCYNKMSICGSRENPPSAPGDYIGFPLNKLDKEDDENYDQVYMGRYQLGLALHAIESHQARFINEKESFKADFYRALVEKIVEDVAPEFKETRRKNVKTCAVGGVENFKEYLKQSLPDLEVMLEGKQKKIDDLLKDINEEKDFHKILAFSALRHMFAPLLEAIVLLDRLLFLKEESSCSYVCQRFDPKISPRVHVITAFK